MRAFPITALAALVLSAALPRSADAQTGELNVFTDLNVPFPPGCLSIDIPETAASAENLLVDQLVAMPSVNSTTRDENVRVQAWRVACDDDGFSVVLVRLDPVDDNALVLVPQVFVDIGDVQNPFFEGQLIKLPGSGNLGASGSILPVDGSTWMLGVNPVSIDGSRLFFFDNYNEEFTLELNPRQFEQPVLNGRYSGQWTLAGAPRQGLVLQIAERISDNFVFAIFFTYLEGQPVWVVGNSTAGPVQPGAVNIPMATLQGGAFISDPNQPLRDEVIPSSAGSISVVPIDCNRLRVDYDFTPLGFGTGTLELDRLVRIAGHDCNPWAGDR